MDKERFIIAVYGSLLSGLGNHRVINDEETELLGSFETKPEYSLYDLGYYPGLKENGNTSVKMEVYSVNKVTSILVDGLEGYDPDRPATFYDKKTIETPFGEASVYIYMRDTSKTKLVESGDWKDYYLSKIKKVDIAAKDLV